MDTHSKKMESKDPSKAKKRAQLMQILPAEERSETPRRPAARKTTSQEKSSPPLQSYTGEENENMDSSQRSRNLTTRQVAPWGIRSQLPGESLGTLPSAASPQIEDTIAKRHRRKKRKHVVIPTEVMAVAHILHDEVRNYMTNKCLPRNERLVLVSWYKAVRDQLTEQNELLVENCRLAAERRDVDKQIMKQRQGLVTLRSNLRGVQSEIKDLESQIAANQQQSRVQRDATRFLEGLGQLAATSLSVQSD